MLSVLGGLTGHPAQAKDYANAVQTLADTTPAIAHGNFGFLVVDLPSGDVLVERAADHLFVPASNTKLYTTAAALIRLGGQYSWQTQLTTKGPWTPGQATITDLQLVGGGDPNLSGRPMPYKVDTRDGASSSHANAFAPIAALAEQIVARGIKEVTGDVTGISGRYADDRYPDGWTVDDSNYSYGAPVTALAVNDNMLTLVMHPTTSGDPPSVESDPPARHFVLINEALSVTGKESHVSVARLPGSNELLITGTVGTAASDWREDIAIEDPALFAAEVLVDTLREKGVAVLGEAQSSYAGNGSSAGTVLAMRQSQPLWQDVQVTNKVSQNLHAEMLLRELGFVRKGQGTLQAGLDERQSFLEDAGIHTSDGLDLEDGSGLARQDLTSPAATVKLLQFMWTRPERTQWLESLPIGAVDGSLQHRFKRIANGAAVHAKTGSYAHVNTLSGYIEQQPGHWLAFSVMVNNTTGPTSEMLDFIDRFCAIFLK